MAPKLCIMNDTHNQQSAVIVSIQKDPIAHTLKFAYEGDPEGTRFYLPTDRVSLMRLRDLIDGVLTEEERPARGNAIPKSVLDAVKADRLAHPQAPLDVPCGCRFEWGEACSDCSTVPQYGTNAPHHRHKGTK